MKNTFILDTNIVVHLIRNESFKNRFEQRYDLLTTTKLISVVTEGELLSLTLQFNWGSGKQKRLFKLINDFLIYPIRTQTILDAYAQIDAYSQGKLSEKRFPFRMSARNMGKNDLWIAATAHVTNAALITTDKDFDHLDKQFINLERIDIDWSQKKV